MDDSILNSVKKLLGMPPEYTAFDIDIIIHINSVLSILNQVGCGVEGFQISDDSAVWSDFLGDRPELSMVKSYTALKVRAIWDPPQAASAIEAMNNQMAELLERIHIYVD